MAPIRRRSLITTFLLILCIMMGLLGSTVFAASPTDRTGEAWFKLQNLTIGAIDTGHKIIENGGSINSTALNLVSGAAFHLDATWGANDTTGWGTGDFMIFDLPMSNIISYAPESGSLNDGYGTWEIYNAGISGARDYKVKFTLAYPALIGTSLTNGKFKTQRSVRDMGNDGATGTTKVDNVDISWTYLEPATPDGPYTRYTADMRKENWGFSSADNTVSYVLRLNEALTRTRFEALANNDISYSPPAKRDNVMVVDVLPDALEFVEVTYFNMYLRGPITATVSGTSRIVQSEQDYYSRSLLTRVITENADESYDAFYSRVKTAVPPCYGIYDKKTIVINLGEVCGSDTFRDVYNRVVGTTHASMKAVLEACLSGADTTEKAAHAKQWIEGTGGTIDSGTGNANGGVFTNDMNVWSYSFIFKTRAVWDISDLDNSIKSIMNTATMNYNTDDEERNSSGATFRRSSAEIQLTPGQLYLLKVDADHPDVPIPDTKFTIQEYVGSETSVADVRADTGDNVWASPVPITTGVDGIIRWQGTRAKYYKIVEVTAADGYNAGSFKLFDRDGNPLPDGIFAMPTDKGIIVRATNERLPAELILNGRKDLTGRNLNANEFTFEVYDENGILVSQGKNDASGHIVFDPIEYTIADASTIKKYTVREVTGTLSGVTFDKSEFRIEVAVTADINGKLSIAESFIDGAIVFKNSYNNGGGSTIDPEPEPLPETKPEPETEDDTVTEPETETEPDPQPPTSPPSPGGNDPDVPPVPTASGNTLVPAGDGWLELNEDGVPLGAWTWDEELEEWIFEEDVPLGYLPATGSSSDLIYRYLLLGMFLFGTGLILVFRSRNKEYFISL